MTRHVYATGIVDPTPLLSNKLNTLHFEPFPPNIDGDEGDTSLIQHLAQRVSDLTMPKSRPLNATGHEPIVGIVSLCFTESASPPCPSTRTLASEDVAHK